MSDILLTALSIVMGSSLLLAVVWLLAVAAPQIRGLIDFTLLIWTLLAS